MFDLILIFTLLIAFGLISVFVLWCDKQIQNGS